MNRDSPEKRMVGDYEIIFAVHIGDREVVVGEKPGFGNGDKYMCSLGESNGFVELHSEVIASDHYPEIMELFGQRISEQAHKVCMELSKPMIQGIPNAALTENDCTVISHNDDLNDKVIVIRPDVLRREYRVATHQVKLCTGGFGASPNSRGSAVYCTDLYSGEHSRFERRDVLGILNPDQMPKWVQHHLQIQQQKQKKKSSRREER